MQKPAGEPAGRFIRMGFTAVGPKKGSSVWIVLGGTLIGRLLPEDPF